MHVMCTFLEIKHLHIAQVTDAASFCSGWASMCIYLNLSACGKFFPHIFDYFQPWIFKSALGKTALVEWLLYTV
jgi:hypothetical protein